MEKFSELRSPELELVVGAEHIAALCRSFLAQDLDRVEIEYICTCLELCEEIYTSDATIAAALFRLSTPAINERLTPESVAQILTMIEAREGEP